MNEQITTLKRSHEYYEEQMKQFDFEVSGAVADRVKAHFKTHSVLDEGRLQGIIIEEICREAARLSKNL
jgi:hypothetical protein